LLTVRWYLKYSLSYRDLVEIMIPLERMRPTLKSKGQVECNHSSALSAVELINKLFGLTA